MTKAERLERDIKRLAEMKAREDELRAAGYRYIAGIDEVGRGPLAGPVYAACVVLPDDWDIPGINDSKKLSAKKRDELSDIIRSRALAYGIGIADNTEIDEINILEATKNAMKRAVDACNVALKECAERTAGDGKADTYPAIDMLLIDAVKLDIDTASESIIKGDEKSLSIAAASIVAKVARDSYMTEMDGVYPGYDFASNKGYGTAKHYDGLRTFGYTPIHRRSFLRKFEQEQSDGTKEVSAELAEKSRKIYAVKKGLKPGLYLSWDECRSQVDGFSGAEYKSFAAGPDALDYLGLSPGSEEYESAASVLESVGMNAASGNDANASNSSDAKNTDKTPLPEGVCAFVDGSYDVSSGRFSCGVVMIRADREGNIISTRELSQAFEDEEAAKLRNVAGEIMGSKTAIDFCLRNGIEEVTIFHDYEGVGKWGSGAWKANTQLTRLYRDYVAKARTRMEIRFVKVAAHSGNKYNDMADRLAKQALGI